MEQEIVKTGKIEEVFAPNQPVVVQIVKEPISTKGPRLSSQISLSGRYLILIPFNDQISLSKKLKTKAERDRLRKLLSRIKPKNFGVIIRTNSEGASAGLVVYVYVKVNLKPAVISASISAAYEVGRPTTQLYRLTPIVSLFSRTKRTLGFVPSGQAVKMKPLV